MKEKDNQTKNGNDLNVQGGFDGIKDMGISDGIKNIPRNTRNIGNMTINGIVNGLFGDSRPKKNTKTIKNHGLSNILNEKTGNEKKLIEDIVIFLNKLEFDHQDYYIQKKNKDQNNIAINKNKPIVNKSNNNVTNPESQITRGGKSYINNKIRHLDNDIFDF